MSENMSFIDYAKNAAKDYIAKMTSDSAPKSIQYAKDGANEAQLQESIFAFNKEVLASYDDKYGDGDGKVSVDEYRAANIDTLLQSALAEYESYGLTMSEEEQQEYKETAAQMSDLAARSIDFDGDGYISVEEESLAYKIADYQDDNYDGKVEAKNLDYAASYIMNITNLGEDADSQNYSTDETGLLDRYAQGEKLSDEEMEQLDKIIADNTAERAEKYKNDLTTNTVHVADKPEAENKSVTIQSWGSKPEGENKYANDCLSRVIANNYPNVKLYSEKYNELLQKIVDTNDLKDANTILPGQSLILPDEE